MWPTHPCYHLVRLSHDTSPLQLKYADQCVLGKQASGMKCCTSPRARWTMLKRALPEVSFSSGMSEYCTFKEGGGSGQCTRKVQEAVHHT